MAEASQPMICERLCIQDGGHAKLCMWITEQNDIQRINLFAQTRVMEIMSADNEDGHRRLGAEYSA